jgi:putative intracellular protease/amidase
MVAAGRWLLAFSGAQRITRIDEPIGRAGAAFAAAIVDIAERRRTSMRILMVLTSHDQLGTTGRKTGFWLEEFAAPYFVFRDAGAELTLASPKGGRPPVDPKSDLPENQTPAMTRFKSDKTAQNALATTRRLAEVKAEDFDTVFYSGGHGPMWDLAESKESIALIESFYGSGKPVALVCHSPGVLRHVMFNDEPLVKGKHVTGFTNGEEDEVKLTKVVPFLVEDELMRLGAIFEKVRNWKPLSIVDGRLITGQNPASSTATAKALLELLEVKAAAGARFASKSTMSTDEHIEYQTRDDILKLLSPEELGAASNASDLRIPEGDEYLDLDHLELGVLRAEANTSGEHMLRRAVVRDATWTKILAVLETPIAS